MTGGKQLILLHFTSSTTSKDHQLWGYESKVKPQGQIPERGTHEELANRKVQLG